MPFMKFSIVSYGVELGLVWVFLSFFLKKVGHQLCTFVGEHTALHHSAFVERLWAESVIAAFVVGGAVHHASNLAPSQRASAHQARFNGDVDGAVNQIFSAE